MKKVFFNLRTSSRERMWDTAREAARVCIPITPKKKQQTSVARSASYKNKKTSLVRKVKRFILNNLPLLNYQSVPGSEDADLLYLWGAFPKNTNKPFVVELDNPFVLSYYNTKVFHLRKNKIKKLLRKAQAITFLSEAAKNHTLELLGQEFAAKSKVLPPYMESRYENNKRPNDGLVRFLFVGLGFRRKGGPELLEAFSKLPHENARLTVITNIDEETKQKYAHDNRITFLPPQSREVLFNEYYSTHDVFVFPTLHESLGVVLLEALSFGMGIITTNVYATPEIVKDGENGRLLSHPFLKPTILNGIETIDPVTMSRDKFNNNYMNATLYVHLCDELVEVMKDAMKKFERWQGCSVSLYKEKYSITSWSRKLQSAFGSGEK